jgi:hypothetical protein
MNSGDTIETNTSGDHFDASVRLIVSGISNADVYFRVKEIMTNSCITDQVCAFLYPDPNFQGNCWSPNSSNYSTPTMSGIDFAAGDTLVIKPQGSISCGSCAQYRYFIGVNGAEIDSFDIKVCSTLSTNENKTDDVWLVYPNPASNQISISNQQYEEFGVVISDVLGKVVYSESIDSYSKVNVSNFKNGVYLVAIYDRGQLIQTRRIVVKH